MMGCSGLGTALKRVRSRVGAWVTCLRHEANIKADHGNPQRLGELTAVDHDGGYHQGDHRKEDDQREDVQ